MLFLRQHGVIGRGGAYIGNDLQNLPDVLRRNLFSCILAREGEEDDPVRSNIEDLKRRISLICLQHQAQERGLISNPDVPWQLEARSQSTAHLLPGVKNGDLKEKGILYNTDPVDLIPVSPSDWFPYDPEMTNNPQVCSLNMNLDDYEEYYRRNYSIPVDASPFGSLTKVIKVEPECAPNKRKLDSVDIDETSKPRIIVNGHSELLMPDSMPVVTPDKSEVNSVHSRSSLTSSGLGEATVDKTERAFKLLHDTVAALKDSGNAALQAGLVNLAARRYDQAIRYCAVAYMKFPGGNLGLLVARWDTDPRLEWAPLLKLLVTTRLNLSMALLKLPEPEPRKAIQIAKNAVLELQPFVLERGKVVAPNSPSSISHEPESTWDEPESTYVTTMELQAKAYFRLGSAQCAMRDFSAAVESFGLCITCTMLSGGKVEAIVTRRFEEAKLAVRLKSKRLRKTMRNAFAGGMDD